MSMIHEVELNTEGLPQVVMKPLPTPAKPAFNLVSRESRPQDSVIHAGGVAIGGKGFAVIAGPCSVEDEESLISTALSVRDAGGSMMRGGAFKPRTSPYSFQGMGESGLMLLARARELTGLPVVTEVMDSGEIELVAKYADMLQVGSRNSQNFSLLKSLGRVDKPILLKRGLMTTIEEFLNSAEYILAAGNPRVVLCERGIRTFETATRNTLDLSAVPILKERTHLPVIVDPSHAVGDNRYVCPLAKAALAVGADGLMVEVHAHPDQAKCDGKQSLAPETFGKLMGELIAMAPHFGRTIKVASPSPR